jgi:valyl-tRNA synthetase
MSDSELKQIELAKAYEPQAVEDDIYRRWEKSGLFNPDNLPGLGPDKNQPRTESFTVMMPPPNATGTLHIGHAMFLTLEDLMTRFARMRGKAALWLPGTDHAAIATNTKVEKLLAKEGQSKYDLGRDGFVEKVKEFILGSQHIIRKQIRKMGSSCDWSREAYTFDETRSRAVREMFVRMFNDGLIYRGYRIVNWCPRCESTLADDEVEYKDEPAKLYYMKYGPFKVATTRPETKLGDTAVAVNPNDDRYKDKVGTEFEVDFGIGPQTIRVIADEEVDPEFGTGVVGITPAHSAVDFAMAEKNQLPIKKVIGEDGKMTKLAGKYAGMTVEECRAAFVKDLEAAGLLARAEDFQHSISICYRCSATVEPLTSRQWFVDVNQPIAARGDKSLKALSLEAVRGGGIEILPERFEKVYYHWMENLRDWCISRQIWFGHRVPVWYCPACTADAAAADEEAVAGTGDKGQILPGMVASVDTPAACPACGGTELKQDEDTLDTWFSSGTWTFSTLGWPEETADLKRFHPTQVLETGYDILFFWIARMILMTEYALGEVPFEKVYLHGLVRDEQGRKMSKSLENIIDPLDVAEKYGTDAVRLSLTVGNTPGNDLKMSEDKIEHFRNFTNKLWNISRFILLGGLPEGVPTRPEPKTLADRWLLARFDQVVESVTRDLEAMNYSRPGETLRDFTWGELADWYLEIAKIEGDKQPLLAYVLAETLKLWHPFMPFVTEEIWSRTFAEEQGMLLVAEWPEPGAALADSAALAEFGRVRDLVTAIRNIRAQYKVAPGKRIDVTVVAGADSEFIENQAAVISGLAKIEKLTVVAAGEAVEKAATAVVSGVTVYVPLGDLVDLGAEKQRLETELAEAKKYRAALAGKLSNESFVSRAPEAVVAGEKAKLAAQEDKLAKLQEQLAALG